MIQAQILYSKLQSIGREIGDNLQRISRSPLLSQDRAFATAIFTNELKIAVQHQYEPEHLFALKESVENLFDYFSFDIADGDVLLVADPYSGGTKGQSLTMAAPLFLEGELVLFPAVRAQMIDLAGEYPGGFHPDAFEVWQENIRITPVKLYKQGVLQTDILRFLLSNSRVPASFKADLEAMYTCLHGAKQQLKTFLGSYGQKTVTESIDSMFEYSRKRVEHHVSCLPETEMSAVQEFEVSEGSKSTIHVQISKKDDAVEIDLSRSSVQSVKPVNSPAALTKAFAVWPFLARIADEIPINEGTLQPFQTKTRLGTILDPEFPAATALAPSITGHFIAEAVYKAIQNGQSTNEEFPPIYGTGPQAVFYPELGAEAETKSIVLAPGYPSASKGFGPPALFGQRMLVSAEELELYHGFKMVSREWTDNGEEMKVSLLNQEDDIYFNLLLPFSERGEYGSLSRTGDRDEIFYESTVNQHVKKGELLVFTYSQKEEQL
ncbi:Acetophenone carboxylase delta subunit [Bacillus paralicheniformis]|uniref:hydantoinase B/oxoprolinase family protein n=1 Tax=Bacillus paralicheniformis TaxID=1648923 RepID=UPI0011BFE37C|nr:hydantoinase B/oxoprolinase family protein [Bacillus paralicheniformis]TWK89602.1 Acetophenone carboxylase delta subunit [Bacillus paralicheniformis]